eukprot:scaffold297_cov164-Ochromonas_danica.AAC.14
MAITSSATEDEKRLLLLAKTLLPVYSMELQYCWWEVVVAALITCEGRQGSGRLNKHTLFSSLLSNQRFHIYIDQVKVVGSSVKTILLHCLSSLGTRHLPVRKA